MNYDNIQLKEAIDQYFLACRVNNISGYTMKAYWYHLKNFSKVIGNIPVQSLSTDHIRRFLANEMGRKNQHTGEELSSYTINKSYSVIRSFCNYLVDEGYIPYAPTDKIKPPKVDKDLPEALSQDEIIRIFDYLERFCSFRDKLIFEFFLDTGCRLNEVANLTIDDVNLDDGMVKVFGKGRKERIVFMGNKLCHDLHRYIMLHRRAPIDEKGLFVSSVEPYKRLTRDGISTMIKRVHKEVGVKGKYGPHKLRHTMATQYIKNGGEVGHLRFMLGHTNITTTQRYVNLSPKEVKEAHHKFSPLDRLDD